MFVPSVVGMTAAPAPQHVPSAPPGRSTLSVTGDRQASLPGPHLTEPRTTESHPTEPHHAPSGHAPSDHPAARLHDSDTATLASTRRAVVLLAGGPLVVLTAVCGAFLIAGVPVPSWAVLVGRWIPALVSLVVLRRVLVNHGGGRPGVVSAWGLRRGKGTRTRFALTCAAGAAAVAVVAIVTALLSATVGAMALQPAQVLVPGILMMLPLVVVFALSTLGEEVVWRAHLPRLLGGGFWRAALIVAFAWTAFHLPLHATYVLQGDMPLAHAAALTAGLLPLSLFLSALAARQDSVWPAVFAHAVPFSAVSLAMDAASIGPEAMWTITGISSALFLSAAMAVAPVNTPARVSTPVRMLD